MRLRPGAGSRAGSVCDGGLRRRRFRLLTWHYRNRKEKRGRESGSLSSVAIRRDLARDSALMNVVGSQPRFFIRADNSAPEKRAMEKTMPTARAGPPFWAIDRKTT